MFQMNGWIQEEQLLCSVLQQKQQRLLLSMASIQPVSERPILTFSFANSQGSSRASTDLDVYPNQRLRLAWTWDEVDPWTEHWNYFVYSFAATLMSCGNKIIYMDGWMIVILSSVLNLLNNTKACSVVYTLSFKSMSPVVDCTPGWWSTMRIWSTDLFIFTSDGFARGLVEETQGQSQSFLFCFNTSHLFEVLGVLVLSMHNSYCFF